MQRREEEYIGRRMLQMKLPGRRRRGRPKKTFIETVKVERAKVGGTEEDTKDRKK